MSKPMDSCYEFGPFRLSASERMLLRDGRPVPLPPKVFDTLLALVENCGHLLEKDRLITMLWPNTFVEEGTLARNISDLRKALGETSEHEYIETVPKRGYRFVAAVSNVSDDALIVERHTRSRIVTEEDEQPLSQATPDSVQSPVVAPQTAAAPARIRRGKLGVTAAATLGAIVVLIALWFLLPRPGSKSKETTVPLKNVSFTQLTDQPGPEYFPGLSPDGKSLIYASRISGNWDIYLQRVGGRNPTNLTRDSPADDTQPAFSPNGERIAFRSEREGGGIYLMGATGESVIRVSDFGYSPSWSPNGEQILVGTERVPQPSTRPTKSQLWAITIKSGERRLITEGDALQARWSPNGQRIAYWSRPGRAGQREDIWTIPADGGEPVAVTNGSTTDLNPVWSPDGKHLYFSSNRGGSMNIWRVKIDEKSGATQGEPEAVTAIGAATSSLHLSFSSDGRRLVYVAQEEIRNLKKIAFDPSTGKAGSEPVSITRGSMQLWFPDPSPDGQWLTCYSMGNQRHVFIVRTDGTDLRDLTDDANRYFWPRWSPDGKRIAFSSRRTGNYELWIINGDGSGLQQLTQGHASPGAHYSPWSPDGTKIAYSIHAPRNDCVIFEPGKAWGERKLEYLASLSDANLSFEGWSFSLDGKKLAAIRHLPAGIHSGIGVYDLESKSYDWFTDFGDWPLWVNDNRHVLFVSQGKILLLDTRTRKYQQVLSVTDEDVDIGSPGLSRDNRTIYFTHVATEADICLAHSGIREADGLMKTQADLPAASPQELWASGCPYEFGAFRLDAAERHFGR